MGEKQIGIAKEKAADRWSLACRENFPLLFVVCLYVSTQIFVTKLFDFTESNSSLIQLISNTITLLGVVFLGCFFVVQFGLHIFYFRQQQGYVVQAWKHVCQQYGAVDRLLGYVVVWRLLTPFLGSNIRFREMISQIIPFTWDPRLRESSRLLHFGHYPWTVLQPFLGYPMITLSLDILYMFWLPLLIFFLLGFSLSVRRRLRLQFLLSFLSVWIFLGTLGATFFSSVGPCFYALVETGENPYGPLLTYLDAVHAQYFLWSRYEQIRMWQAYIHHAPFGGITAMPSLHVAGATLLALGTWAIDRRLGWVFIGYAIAIQLGSVHLGWHYALDGYLSLIFTWMIWRLVGWGIEVTAWLPPDEENTLNSPLYVKEAT